ncbi:hypothetical protein HYH03_011289 [Edaphochlamys debaryana]|uniref:Protein kinase domain-containing protein n=1 Tax=Edaphochlamys debaryana TaxID=47281 RepID=A0A835XVF9_9CHLO|nr:hypothetical protein HYH03_011289 [Edaphochlamys debaryana]|eukprot:KAG2490342.1 hypothetical protein HYH03_011289 [Edaphochlamys debaryana]
MADSDRRDRRDRREWGTDDAASSDDDTYDTYGTPPTRSALKRGPGGRMESKRSVGKPHRSTSTKALEAHARQGKQGMRRMSKGRRQKARQKARFFKEIDTTLEALGIGTAAAAAAGGPGGAAGGGMPPSPAGSSLSLSLAPSSDHQVPTPTPTAAPSRADTPPLGPAGGSSGGGGFGRRVTSDVSLRSSDWRSGHSTPERQTRAPGLLAAELGRPPTAPPGAPASLTGMSSEAGAALPPRSPSMAIAAAGGERRRTTSMPPGAPGQGGPQHRRVASYEGEGAAAAAGGGSGGGGHGAAGGTGGGGAGAGAAVAGLLHQPVPLRGAWGTALTPALAAPAAPPPSSDARHLLMDRDLFRRQLGQVLVGKALTADELEAGVVEAEERRDGLVAELEALVERAEDAGQGGSGADSEGEEFSLDLPPSWSSLAEMLDSLDDLYRRAKEVLRKAKPIRSMLAEDPELLPRLAALALQLLAALTAGAEALGNALAIAVRSLGNLALKGSADDVRGGGRLVRRLLDALDHLSRKIRDDLAGGDEAAAQELLGQCEVIALRLARAGIRAAVRGAHVLLGPAALSPDSSAHERSNQGKRMAALWDEASRQTDRISRRHPRHKLELVGALTGAYAEAGALALPMVAAGAGPEGGEEAGAGGPDDPDASLSGADDDLASVSSYDSAAHTPRGADGGAGRPLQPGALGAPGGAWGARPAAWGGGARRPGAAGPSGRGSSSGGGGAGAGLSDKEILAQAWVPALLQVLLNRASEASKMLRHELSGPEPSTGGWGGGGGEEGGELGQLGSGGPSGPTASGSLGPAADLTEEELDELCGVLDCMQRTFGNLTVANLRRTVRLCSACMSTPLPVWALECVRDCAEATLRFVHTHDNGSLGLGEMLELGEEDLDQETTDWLHRTWYDITSLSSLVVNGLLTIRRQINVRRNDQSPPPRPAAPRTASGASAASAGSGSAGGSGLPRAPGSSAASSRAPSRALSGSGRGRPAGAGRGPEPAAPGRRDGGGTQYKVGGVPLRQTGGSGVGGVGAIAAASTPQPPSLQPQLQQQQQPGAAGPSTDPTPEPVAAAPLPRWKAALLTPAAPEPSGGSASGGRPSRNSLEAAGPGRPGPPGSPGAGPGSVGDAGASGPDARGGSAQGPGPSGRKPLAGGEPRRAGRDGDGPGSGGAGGRGGGGGVARGGGIGGRGHGRLFGRGRRAAREDEDEGEGGSVASEEQRDGPGGAAGAAAAPEPAPQDPTPAPVPAPSAAPPGNPSYAAIARAAAAVAAARQAGAGAGVPATTAGAGTGAFRSPFATAAASSVAHRAAGVAPPLRATLPSASPFAAAALQPPSPSASPTAASPQRSPQASAPPSPPRPPSPGSKEAAPSGPGAAALAASNAVWGQAAARGTSGSAGGPLPEGADAGAGAGPGTAAAPSGNGHGPVSGGDASSGGSSFQFTPAKAPGARGTSAASSGSPASGAPPTGQLTPRLGSPSASGLVLPQHYPAPAAAPIAPTTLTVSPAAILAADARHDGMAPTDFPARFALPQPPQQPPPPPPQQQQRTASPHSPQRPLPHPHPDRSPSLTAALSLGGGNGLARLGSEGLAPGGGSHAYTGPGGYGGHPSAPPPNPELVGLLRAIAHDPFWAIRWADLSQSLSTLVGAGSTGQVFAGMYLHAEVAIKVIGINRDMKFDIEALRAFKAEVDLNKRLNNHPNIVRFIGVCADYIHQAARQAGLMEEGAGAGAGPQQPVPRSPSTSQAMLAIVMEFCHLGTLWNMIGEARRASQRGSYVTAHAQFFLKRWERRLEVLCGAAAGLEYMHRMNVIHHDFTSYNLLLDERLGKWTTKVCDFNLSRVVARGPGAPTSGSSLTVPNSGNMYSPRWQSPEYLAGEEYGWSTDVFSFGVVIWEVVTLQQPWASELAHHHKQVEPWIIRTAVTGGQRLAFPDPATIRPDLPELSQLIELANACWAHEPKDRPRMSEVADRLQRILASVREREEARRAAARAAAAAPGHGPAGPTGSGSGGAPAAAAPAPGPPPALAPPSPAGAASRASPFARAPQSPFAAAAPVRVPPSPFAAAQGE